MIDQGLKSFFIHKISEIAQGCRQNKKENGGAGDDGDFDPFQAGQESDGEKENVSREGYKNGDQQCVLVKEWEGGCIFIDGDQDNNDDDQGDNPPQEFCDRFVFIDGMHIDVTIQIRWTKIGREVV